MLCTILNSQSQHAARLCSSLCVCVCVQRNRLQQIVKLLISHRHSSIRGEGEAGHYRPTLFNATYLPPPPATPSSQLLKALMQTVPKLAQHKDKRCVVNQTCLRFAKINGPLTDGKKGRGENWVRYSRKQ